MIRRITWTSIAEAGPVLAIGALAAICFGLASWGLLTCGNALGDVEVPRWIAVGVGMVSLLAGTRWTAFFVMAYTASRRRNDRIEWTGEWPRVSILVPACNEGKTIEAALQSLLELDYPRYDVIVVDDGSKDETYRKARAFEGDDGRCAVRIYRKPNGGKWSALNYAFHRCDGELVLCVDADSRLDRDALRKMVVRMKDPRVGGVAGQVRVRNRINVLTRLQGLEYIIANGLLRMAQSLSGTVLVIPGPLGLYRRTVLEEVYLRFGKHDHAMSRAGDVDGPLEGDTFAEDFDLSLAVLSLGYLTLYEPGAVSHTKAPAWTFALLNQRYRWCRGSLQVLRKLLKRWRENPGMLPPRLLVWVGLTYVLELAVLPAVSLLAMALGVALLAGGIDPLPILGWAAALMLLNLNAAAIFTAIHNDSPRNLTVLPLFDLYHGFLLNSGWAIAIADELRGRAMRW